MTEDCADWEDIRSTVHDQKFAQSLAEQALQHGFRLSNDLVVPALGLGTFGMPDFPKTSEIVSCALECGYRHIDASAQNANEQSIGDGINISGIRRSEIFVTSKVPKDKMGYQATMDSFFHSLNELDLDYLDLFLLQWPINAQDSEQWEEYNFASWKALMELYEEGYVHAIGVANFMPHHLRRLLDARIPPMVNQIEFHPGWSQLDNVMYCQSHNIQVEGWGIFGDGRLLKQDFIVGLAAKYQTSPAQICLRYALQHKVLPLPRSSVAQNISANLNCFGDFVISDSDMRALDALNEFKVAYSCEDPDRR